MIGGGPQKITVEIGGKIAASLATSLRGAQTQVSSFGRNVTRTMNDAAMAGRKGFKGMLDSAMWQQATVGATAFAGAIGLSVREAMKFDSAMADIRKAIDFSDGEKGVKRFGRELIKLSTELPYTAEQLTKIAASAGFAGYAENEIIPFTRSAAAMGVAFQMTAEQAGDSMVAIRAAMGLTQPEVVQLGDAINYLSDKFQGTVNAADLVEVTKRIGAIGKSAGLAKEEIAGLGAAFLASGTPTEVAATGLKNFLNALTKGSEATKKQRDALTTIFGSDVSKQLAKGMQTNAQATIKSVIQGLSKLPKEQQVSIAGALFGEESKAAIMPLLTNTKLINQAFDLIADKSAFAGSMQKEFQNQMGTSAAQAQIFRSGIQAVGISVGSALLPSLNSILKAVTPLLIRFGEWAQKNEGLVTSIVLVGGALAGLVIALPIIAGVVSAIGTIGAAIGAVTAAFPVLAGIGTVIAVAGGPITAIIAGIVGIGLAIKAVVDYWPEISTAATRSWWQIKGVWGQFTRWVSGIFNNVLTMARTMGQRIVGFIIDGLKAKVGALFGWIRNTWSSITGFFSGSGGGGSASAGASSPGGMYRGGGRSSMAAPGRALGGRVLAGQPYTVGERRRELFVPGMDGAIIPRIARPVTAGNQVTINAPVTIHASGDGAGIREQVRQAFEDLMAMASSGYRVALND